MDLGSAVSRASGITEQQLRELHDHATSEAFSSTERLVLSFAEGLTRTPARVSQELFESLRAEFDEAQLVELTAMVAWENYRARTNRAFDVESQGYCGKGYCVVVPQTPQEAGGEMHERP